MDYGREDHGFEFTDCRLAVAPFLKMCDVILLMEEVKGYQVKRQVVSKAPD